MTNQVYKFDNIGQLSRFDAKDIRIPEPLVQDEILDKSNYIPNSESIRKSVITGDGLSRVGVYDEGDTMPSNEFVNFRSGKYDKAEISDMINDKNSAISKELDEMKDSIASNDSSTKVGDSESK